MDPVQAIVEISELRKARGERPDRQLFDVLSCIIPPRCNIAHFNADRSYNVNICKATGEYTV